MIGWERRVLLRHYLDQGLTVTEMARELETSRQTVYRWVRSGELDRDVEDVRYGPRPSVPTKLDPYKGILRERLDAYPELTAVRLLAEIRAAGYPGGYTQLKEYVRTVRPRPPEEPEVRFETAPGMQAQVDFAHFRFPWGRRYALLVVLGFSRLLWLRFYRRQDMRTLIRGLEAAFGFFGGVPREVLFDQMRSVIVRDLRPEGGRLIENAEFLRFCAHWGFRPRACRLASGSVPPVDVERRPWPCTPGSPEASGERAPAQSPGLDPGSAGRPQDARRARGPRSHPLGRRRRPGHPGGGHRTAPRGPDSAAQQPTSPGRHAQVPAAGREDAGRFRLQLPALHQARTD